MSLPLRNLQVMLLSAALLGAPAAAQATSAWATWVADGPNTATGSFPDGRSVGFSGYVAGIDDIGELGTADPAIPGEPSGVSPTGIAAYTGVPHPTMIAPGALILEMDLTNLPIDDETTFALSDLFDEANYRLELLDDARGTLPLDGIVVMNYNLALNPPASIFADYDVTLDLVTGALRVQKIHDGDPPGSYRHSGFATLTKLPAATRFLRITSDAPGDQASEGVHFFIGAPEPRAAWLAVGSAATLAGLRRRRDRSGTRDGSRAGDPLAGGAR